MSTTYSVDEVYLFIRDEARRHPDATCTILNLVEGTTIVMRESGGDTRAICYNYDNARGKPACSKVPLPAGTPGVERGIDRGWWEFNDKSNPEIPIDDMFNPKASTEWAYKKSAGFTAFVPWGGNDVHTGKGWAQALDAAGRAGDFDTSVSIKDVGDAITAIPGLAAESTGAAAGKLFPWADSLGALLSRLIDPAFWRRFGLGALGILLVLIAVILVVAESKLGSAA